MSVSTLPGSFKLDRSRSASIQVYEHLRDLIVTLSLQPGATLSRADLADYFNVSLTPIRDALSRLDEERLVEVFPQHVTRVRAVDLDSAREAHFLRLSVELEIVHTLAQEANPALAAHLLNLVARQQACLKQDDLAGFTAIDMELHQAMYEAAGLPNLWLRIRAGSGNLDRLRRLHLPLNGKARSILEEHTEIAHAIASGDPAQAQDWVRRHLSGTLSELNALRARYPDFLLPIQ
ncbi:GntR family transcriptional regulator [Oxalobacteraceae bacterium A2-2]